MAYKAINDRAIASTVIIYISLILSILLKLHQQTSFFIALVFTIIIISIVRLIGIRTINVKAASFFDLLPIMKSSVTLYHSVVKRGKTVPSNYSRPLIAELMVKDRREFRLIYFPLIFIMLFFISFYLYCWSKQHK